jgi:enoyl-CoA hydratase
MTQNLVILKRDGTKATIQISRPEALNALNSQVISELRSAVEQVSRFTDVSTVIVSGAGDKAFVAGADIKEMQGLTAEQAAEFSRFGAETFAMLENLPQIVIAKVQGWALGGGLELALACDFIVASEKARFGLPEVSLGLIPGFGGTQRLARRLGVAKALEWLATGSKYTAQEALQSRLVNHVVAPEELDAFTDKLVESISKNSRSAVQSAKNVLRQGMETSLSIGQSLESGYFGLRFGTEEAKEGMLAFQEKRQPQFRKSQ